MIRRIAAAVCLLALSIVSNSRAAEQGIRVVVAQDAPPLEQFAAQQCAQQLSKLTGKDVALANSAGDAATVVLIGSPRTSPQVRKAVGEKWPKLSEQGFVLRQVASTGKLQLVVGGDTPRATLWAVYELGHHFGIRYLLKQDIYPPAPAKLDLKVDRVVEPVLKTRSYRLINDFAMGSESWPLKDQKQLLGQLAKMKFNRVMLSVYPWLPFVQYTFAGVV